MPPAEQVEGREADARTDIFALGVVLYEMISGGAPFNGDSRASLAAAILTSTPRRSRHAQARSRRSSIASSRSAWRKTPSSAGRAHATWRRRSNGARPTPHAIATRRGRRSRRWRAAAIAVAAIAATLGLAALVMWASGWPPAVFSPGSTAGVFHQATYRRGAVSSARFTADGRVSLTAPAGKTDRGGPTWGVR